ncbi:MAG: ligand-binding SRPBCC domain-containing protein [Crocinitomix sp.]|jgi:ligand-binding SRPBCC domain-containing protein
MKDTIIKRKVTINASKEKVWEILADFGNVQNLSPNIAKSYLTSDALNGVGATRHCDFTAMGARVEEKIVEWNEGNSFKIHLYDAKNLPMLRGMQAHFELTSQNDATVLTGIFQYNMSNAIGNLLNSLTMRKMNEKSWIQFMAGIKHNTETGENVNKDTKLDLTVVEA